MLNREKQVVIVDCDKKERLKYRRFLKKYRVYWVGANQFCGCVTDYALKRIEEYCKSNKLHYYIENKYKRSTDYRRKYFRQKKPFLGKLYFCAYCGNMYTKKNITVDHIISIESAKSRKIQRKLERKNIDINSLSNLTTACARCNRKKSDKQGMWFVRGKIGQWLTKFPVIFFSLWLVKMGFYSLILYYTYITITNYIF